MGITHFFCWCAVSTMQPAATGNTEREVIVDLLYTVWTAAHILLNSQCTVHCTIRVRPGKGVLFPFRAANYIHTRYWMFALCM